MLTSPDSEFQLILAAAHRFRRAFEAGGLESISFREFPRGACGDASELLGEYLRDCGLGDWMYISGIESAPDGNCTHAWLECDGIYIDITGDQFVDCDKPVVVTRSPLWEGRFSKSGGSHLAGLSYFDPESKEICRDYQCIRARADSSC